MSADAPERGVQVLSDGTEISFRALTIAERDRLAKIQAGVSLEIADEILASDALVIAWTITTAVTSPSRILEILFAGMEAGRIAYAEMIDLHNAILDFSGGQRLAAVRPKVRHSDRQGPLARYRCSRSLARPGRGRDLNPR
jgi:hypothetical protein